MRIDYQPILIQTNFSSPLTIDPPINNTQVWLPSRVTYPTGMNFRFVYNNYGQMVSIGKFVPAIPGQGAERQISVTAFTNEPFYYPLTDCPKFINRVEGAENWQNFGASIYYYDSNAPNVYDPSGRNFRAVINGLQQSLEVSPTNTQYGAEVKTDYVTYEQDAGVPYLSNLRVVERKSVVSSYATPISVRKTRYAYTPMDGIWLETVKDDYTGETAIYRRTTTEYLSYPERSIFGLPTNVRVYAGPGTILMSRITNAYDELGTFTDSNNLAAHYLIDASADSVIQHDNQNYGIELKQRGNLTSVVQHLIGTTDVSRVTQRTSYDTNGNRRAETDGAGNRQQFSFSDNYSNKPSGVGQTHVYLFTSANPHGFKTGSQYDYFNGNIVKSFNQRPGSSAEEQPLMTTYDFADRWVQRLRGDGGWMRMRYWDNWLAGVKGQKLDTTGGVDQVHFSFELFDGAGRVLRKANDHPDGVTGKYSGQNFTYDSIGDRSGATSVIAVNGEWAPGWDDSDGWQFTTATQDHYDRTRQITRPDGNIMQYEYTGCSCAGSEVKTMTDEAGNKMRTETDIFGHVVVVSELATSPGNPVYAQVSYSYDVLDRLVSITHAKAGGAQYQTRTFSYDGYGRLVSETHPEGGTITYTYKPNDLVESVSNQRGMTAAYSYNTRNLVTQVSYNDGGATPTATFGYDDFGSRTTMSDGEGQTTYAYNIHRQMQSETRTFGSLPNNTFGLSYTWSQADQVKSVHSQITAPASGGAPFTQTDSSGSGSSEIYNISGTVRDQQNQPISQVTITLSGGQSGQTTTNSQGQYSFTNLGLGGSYTLTPSKSGYVFSPSSRTYNNLNSHKTAADFTGSPTQQITFNKTINYARNNTGAIAGIGTDLIGSDPNATTNVTSAMTYRAWNAYRGMNFGNGLRLTAQHSSERQQMTSFMVDAQNGSSWLWRQYYDYYENGMDNGKIRRISDQPNFSTYNWHEYDAYGRLTSVQSYPGFTWQSAFTYDEWGNLRSIGSIVGGGGTITYQTNATGAPTNRISTAGPYNFSYDAAGNMTAGTGQTYSYDAANRLKGVNGAPHQYGYDGDGKRVRQPGLSYLWSTVLDKVALEVDASATVQRAYVYLGSEVAALRSTDGNFYWVHSDHLSSGRMLTNTAGSVVYRADFDPFGQVSYEWSSSGNMNLNPLKFTGYKRDATGLDYARARTYTSSWGRFAQADPFGSGYGGQKPSPLGAAKRDRPQTLNRYSYVHNDPINQTDPSGLLVPIPNDGCICCGGGGEGGGGGQPCINTCNSCCKLATVGCVFIAGGCAATAITVYNNAQTACLNNSFCDTNSSGYSLEKCDRCLDTARNNLLIAESICAAALIGCLLLRSNVCSGRETCTTPKTPCKC